MKKMKYILCWLSLALVAVGLTACNDSTDDENATPNISGTYQGSMIYYNDTAAKNDTLTASWTLTQDKVQIASFNIGWIAGKLRDDNLKEQIKLLANRSLTGNLQLFRSNPALYYANIEDVSYPVEVNGKTRTLTLRFVTNSQDSFLAYDRTSNVVMLQVKVLSAFLDKDKINLLTDTPSFLFYSQPKGGGDIHYQL